MSYPKLHQVKRQIIKDLGVSATESEIQAEYDSRKSEYDSMILKGDAKKRYEEDVYTEMKSIFGTTKTDTAIANYETLKLKVSKPSLFVEESEEAALVSDSQTKIDQIEAYVVYRETRYKQYLSEIENI